MKERNYYEVTCYTCNTKKDFIYFVNEAPCPTCNHDTLKVIHKGSVVRLDKKANVKQTQSFLEVVALGLGLDLDVSTNQDILDAMNKRFNTVDLTGIKDCLGSLVETTGTKTKHKGSVVCGSVH